MTWFQWIVVGLGLLAVILLFRLLQLVSYLQDDHLTLVTGLTDAFERVNKSLDRIEAHGRN